MLHKVVEHCGAEVITPHLSKIMPGLIQVSLKLPFLKPGEKL